MSDKHGFLLIDALFFLLLCAMMVLITISCAYMLHAWQQADQNQGNEEVQQIYAQ